MKSGRLTKLYAALLLMIFVGIIVHAPLSVGFGTLFPGGELLIKSWKEFLLIAASVLGAWFVWRHAMWQHLVRDRTTQVAIGYIFLHILLAAALLTEPIATLAGLAIDLRYVIFFLLIYILLGQAPEYKKYFLKAAGIGAIIVVGFGTLQLFLPADILSHIGYNEQTIQPYLTVDKNPDYIRINSTLRGPNPLGAYIVIVLSLLAAAIVRGRVSLKQQRQVIVVGITTLMSTLVLWVTYSRSAVLAAGIALGTVAVTAARPLISRRLWIAGCVVLFALTGGIVLGRDHAFVTNVILHENREGGSPISSNDGHLESLIDGTERMLRQPIGGGIGSTGSASLMTDTPLIIENQYLFIAHEAGWLGLGLFIALLALIFVRLWHRRQDWLALGVFASGIGLACIGLLQPVFVDDTVSIIWWGLAAVAIAPGGMYARTTKQKTK